MPLNLPGERKRNMTDEIKQTKLSDWVLPELFESLNDDGTFISKSNYN